VSDQTRGLSEFDVGADGEIRTPNLRFTNPPNASFLVGPGAASYSAVQGP
jgi:hypothetical protein